MNSDQLPRLVESFLNAGTFDQCRGIVDEHPELLKDEVDELLVTHGSDGDLSVRRTRNSRRILLWCRLVGVSLTFAVLKIIAQAGPQRWIARHGDDRDFDRLDTWMRDHDLTGSESSWEAVQLVNADAFATYGRFRQVGDVKALSAAVSKWGAILRHREMVLYNQYEYAGALARAAHALFAHYGIMGALADLDRSLQYRAKGAAIVLFHHGEHELATHVANIGVVCRQLYAHKGDESDLHLAIESLESAAELQLVMDGAESSGVFNNLALALYDRSVRNHDSEDLKRAIDYFEKASRLNPTEEEAPAILNNLGLAFRVRYLRSGDMDDLTRAIAAFEKGVERAAAFVLMKPAILENLGRALQNLYGHGDRREDLNRAITAFEEALNLTPKGSPEVANRQHNLSSGLRARYVRSEDLNDLKRAIEASRTAVLLTAETAPAMPLFLSGLSESLISFCHVSPNDRKVQEAVAASERAVRLSPPDAADLANVCVILANAYASRHASSHAVSDVKKAREAYESACNLGMRLAPQAALRAGEAWGDWASTRMEWQEAVTAYSYCLTAFEELFKRQSGWAYKEDWLHTARGVFARAAYARARVNDLRGAVVTLELGRGRLFANHLALDTLRTSGHAELHEQYVAAVRQLAAVVGYKMPGDASPAAGHSSAEVPAAYAAFKSIVSTIREIAGYEDFLRPITFERIERAVDRLMSIGGSEILYIAASPSGGVGLLVGAGGKVTRIWMDDLTDKAVELQLLGGSASASRGMFRAYAQWRENPHDESRRSAWFTALDATTNWLWQVVIAPLLAVFPSPTVQSSGDASALTENRPARPLTMVPYGALGLLPLHAAWTSDAGSATQRRYALDGLSINYGLNIISLLEARLRAAARAGNSILAIDNPDASLSFSSSEIAEVVAPFSADKTTILGGTAATKKNVLQHMSSYAVLHFSTHGIADFINPLHSFLWLAGGDQLSLSDVLQLQLDHARLAVLSACESGLLGIRLPDEVSSLPNGLCQAGVPGVVASLWLVEETCTKTLMGRFYHLWQKQQLQPAEALRRAQIEVRDAGSAHPFYWGAFSCTGV